jgi:hypothetical protein
VQADHIRSPGIRLPQCCTSNAGAIKKIVFSMSKNIKSQAGAGLLRVNNFFLQKQYGQKDFF